MEWIILLIAVALLLFGAKKIPEFARGLGKAKAEFQRGQMIVEEEIRNEQRRQAKNISKTKTKSQSSKLVKAATALGIDTEDKSDQQLKEEIAQQLG